MPNYALVVNSHRSNWSAWTDPTIVGAYRDPRWINAAEKAVLEHVGPKRRGGRIVELGVGGGRLTPLLLEISRDYLGIDYSEGMIELCRAKFPGVSFERGDALELSAFPACSADLVVFSFNGLDYASHEDRQRILRGVARLLKPGGDFVFSSHNRSMEGYDRFPIPWPPIRHQPLRGPLRLAVGLCRHWLLRRYEVRTPDYAIINEPEFNYALMTYYVTIGEQLRQLRACGFGDDADVFSLSGEKVTSDTKSRSLYFRATRGTLNPSDTADRASSR